MKTYTSHRCNKAHRSYRTFMECAIPRAAWVRGDGAFAVIAWCRVPSVELHPDLESAEAAKASIDQSACGGKCVRNHEIVRVVLPGAK